MASFRVLLLGKKDRLDELPALLSQASGHDIAAETLRAVHDVVTRVSEKGYDAVICWAEKPDELAGVIRIRKANPDLPIMVVTSQQDPKFKDLAARSGATRTALAGASLLETSEYIRLCVQSGELRKELLAQVRWAHSQAQEVSSLAKKTSELAQEARAELARMRQTTFVPLLVEDDPDQALLMVKAFAQADVFSPLPILRSGEELIAFLTEKTPYQHRGRLHSPSLILLDVHLPGKSGLEVLEWIRTHPKFHRLPVVMLSSSTNPDYINRAYTLGAKSYLIKPTSFSALVEMVSALKRDWGAPPASEP